jgi:hypothetical protein
VTRYLCVDPSHTLGGEPASIDVTAQVRLEREFLPRESTYLADTEDVVGRVRDLQIAEAEGRVAAVRRILTGTSAPLDAPVVLVSGDRVGRVPGLYEMDELRRSERSVAILLDRYAQANLAREGSDDLVVLEDDPTVISDPTGRPLTATEMTATQQAQRTSSARVLPQGVYPVLELASRLAEAPTDERSIVEAIHATPSYGATRTAQSRQPWRVVVECPVATGEPPIHHQVVFTGTGDPEPAEVLGTPAAGGDVVLERQASTDAVLPFPAARAERRLRFLLIGAAAAAAALLVLTWISGALALAARETPVWLGLAVTLAVAGFAVGLIALASRTVAEGNANDMYVLRRHYASRLDMLWYATLATGVLFAVAAAVGVVPPILTVQAPVPAAAITFNAGQRIVTATVQVPTQGVATDEPVSIEMRQYSTEAATGVVVGRATTTGDPSGSSLIVETVSLDRGARYLSVLVTNGDQTPPTCSPMEATGPGCTVVSVPPLGAGVVRFIPAVPIDLATEPTASAVPTSSAVATPSASPSFASTPTITSSPTP